MIISWSLSRFLFPTSRMLALMVNPPLKSRTNTYLIYHMEESPPPSQLISTPDTSEASQLFFRGRGERVSHLKSTMRTLRGSEGEGPRTIARFQFLKRFKVLENESIFQKYQHFSCPKSPFYKNNFDKLNIHYRNF